MTGGCANRRSDALRAAALVVAALALGLSSSASLASEREKTAKKHETVKKHEPVKKHEAAKPLESAEARAFAKFVEELWPDAKDAGVKRQTFDAAFRGVTFDATVVAHTKAQEEFVRPIWNYLDDAVSARRIVAGKAKYEAEKPWIEKARREFGVSEAVIMGIWGMESEFGGFEGADYVIRSLASLAYVKYQGDYFRSELIAALAILEEGDIAPRDMRGSWAGAMGETQFMPSSFRQYAIDFDGKGRRDIWTDAADAIGSTANYLAKHGWKANAPWGFEVTLPEGFRLTAADSNALQPFAEFAKRGVKRAEGEPMPTSGEGRLLTPAGLKGPIFLVTENFRTIKSYNNSTSYALGVALLGDAILGAHGLTAAWPRRDARLSGDEIKDLQARLTKLGYDVGDIDGKAGDKLTAAVRGYQESIGEPPDGYATPALLKRLKAKT